MKMFFKEEEKVTIVNHQKGNTKITRQSISDYLTGSAVVRISEIMKTCNYVLMGYKEVIGRQLEVSMLLNYLPFIEIITLLPSEPKLKIKVAGRKDDIEVQVSEELYNFFLKSN